MGIFGTLKRIIRRKREDIPPDEPLEPIPPLTSDTGLEPLRETPSLEPIPRYPEPKYSEKDTAEMINLRAKIDLLLTQIESVQIQNKNIDERLKNIEKTLAEMKGIRYY